MFCAEENAFNLFVRLKDANNTSKAIEGEIKPVNKLLKANYLSHHAHVGPTLVMDYGVVNERWTSI